MRQPKTHEYTLKRLRKFIEDHPYVNVLRFTTFFHQFTLVFDELAREKYVDWYGYSASVSPYILKQFAKELTKEKPYDKISISDIADRCGIKRQTFYYHFQDKYELLVWIYFNELFAPNMEGISLENWDEKLGAILTQMQEEKKFYINTIKHAEDYIIQYMLEVAEQTFEEAIDKLDEKSHLKNEERGIFARFFAYGICGIIVEWAKGGMKMAPEKLADYMREMLEKCKQAVYISDHDRQ